MSPDQVVRDRPRKWRKGGDEALKPKPKGRPKGAANPKMLTEGDKLPREYDQLRTDNAYLKKIAVLEKPGTLLKNRRSLTPSRHTAWKTS
ncbi:hypothetical protein RAE07_08740 [Corynebacterium kefirresidentii]|nr:hypothetical protein [Corynebacterium kefirresidentii]MDV2415404.1 hypothetical protein [Corynebacterium kefirresidentii]